MANETGLEINLCFFITRVGEEGFPEREQADGVMDAIVKPVAEKLGLECVRADQLPDPGQITTQIIARIVAAKMVVADLAGGNPNVYYELAVRNSFRLRVVSGSLLATKRKNLVGDMTASAETSSASWSESRVTRTYNGTCCPSTRLAASPGPQLRLKRRSSSGRPQCHYRR